MQYLAIITREGDATLAEFPDCPGCQTFARKGQDLYERAKDALEGWLEIALEDGEAPPRPGSVAVPAKAKTMAVQIDSRLAVAIAFRWARLEASWSQSELARRVGVSQQQIAKLEQPDANPTLETIEKVAKAFGLQVDVELRPALAHA